jgi:hypothetical protein
MADQADYADRLRETLLALALVPPAGFATATFWLRESLDRTSKLGGDVVASTALGHFTRARSDTDGGKPDPAAEVLALDLLDSAQTYVRSMVRLPADAGVYFTGELEQRFNVVLERIRPEAEQNVAAYADAELQQLAQELDRLLVIARAEATRPTPSAVRLALERARAKGKGKGKVSKRVLARARKLTKNRRAASKLVETIEELRTRVQQARPKEGQRVRAALTSDAQAAAAGDRFTAARARTKARVRIHEALREAETLVPAKKKAIARLNTLVNKRIPSSLPGTVAT